MNFDFSTKGWVIIAFLLILLAIVIYSGCRKDVMGNSESVIVSLAMAIVTVLMAVGMIGLIFYLLS